MDKGQMSYFKGQKGEASERSTLRAQLVGTAGGRSENQMIHVKRQRSEVQPADPPGLARGRWAESSSPMRFSLPGPSAPFYGTP